MFQLLTAVSAQNYYADVTINVDSDGLSTISGRTNHPSLEVNSTDAWTSKTGSIWAFNLSLPVQDTFSDYIYSINLPEGASIDDVKSSGTYRIAASGEGISVRGSGENSSFSVYIQYQFDNNITNITSTTETTQPPQIGNNNQFGGYLIFGMILFIILVMTWLIFKQVRRRRVIHHSENNASKETLPPLQVTTSNTNEEPESVDSEELSDFDALTERQKIILETVKQAGKPINQAIICEKLDLPKSSVSRNIDALERKGLINKTRNGMSTMISIKKD